MSAQQELLRPIGPRAPAGVPSSSTDGFFQEPPAIQNQLFDDIALQRSLRLFLPESVRRAVQPELAEFGNKVISKEVFDLIADAEKNLPYLKTWVRVMSVNIL
jgi:hypothetical protein